MNARIYDPDIGRFLSPDPTIAHPDNPQSFNRYSYVYNNPLNAVDPTGFTVEGNESAFTGSPATAKSADTVGTQNKDADATTQSATNPKSVGAQLSNEALKGAWNSLVDTSVKNNRAAGNDKFADFVNNFRIGNEKANANDLAVGAGLAAGLQISYDLLSPSIGGKAKAAAAVAPAASAFKGGAYGKLSAAVNVERHHMPANSVSSLSRGKGPSIQMEKVDHQKTASFGSSNAAVAFREESKSLIDAGKMRDAMAKEIQDVRSIAGSKYNEAVREMLDYAKQIGILNK
jgi:hypothetical protein